MDEVQVWLKHPRREESPVAVENTAEALTPWMVKGYQQCAPPAEPAEKE